MSVHQQWRAVGITRTDLGDIETPGLWRDRRPWAERDTAGLGTPDTVIETRITREDEVDRVPVILREAPRPEPGRMAYIGSNACGCVTFALVISDGSQDAEARELAQVAATGRRIDRVTIEEANLRLTVDCTHREAA